MTHITKLTEIVDGRLLPSDKKLSASLLEVDAGRLTISGDTLGFDEAGLATETFVTNAIASAQLNGGEVDLSGYTTKTELNEAITGVPLLVDTKVNTAIASVVDSAPATFDTLKEIATWIETEGVDTAGLAASIAGKVDKEAGKGLSTNDFTTELKEKLILTRPIRVDGYDDSVSIVHVEEQGAFINYKIDTPSVGKQMRTDPKEFMSPSKVNSVPLYSLDNDGEFVLTEPDSWVSFNDSNFVFPVYHLSTVDNTYLKGIVTLSVERGSDGEGNPTLDFKYTHNVKDVIDGYEVYVNYTFLSFDETVFHHTFTSSIEGETVFGTIKVPLSYSASGHSLQQAINDFEDNGFPLRFELVLKSGSKRTVMVRTIGITQEAQPK